MFVAWLATTVLAIESGMPVRWVRCPLFAFGAVAGFALGRVLEPLRPVRQTLAVYVAHLPLIVATVLVLSAMGLPAFLVSAPVSAVLAVAALAIAGALLLHRALERTRAGRLMYAPAERFREMADRSPARRS